MKLRRIAWCSLMVLFVMNISCRSDEKKTNVNKTACVGSDYTELPAPSQDAPSKWSDSSSALRVSFVSIDQRYPKSVEPEIDMNTSNRLVTWKGETVSAQALLWSSEEVPQVRVQFSDFKNDDQSLSSDIAEARFVRYVMTDEFAEGCGYRKPEDFAASLSADVLDNTDCMDIEGQTVRPVWFTLKVPEDAEPGVYHSTVTISSTDSDKESRELELELEVIDQILPPPSEWAFHLDQWQHPSAVARVDSVEVWSDAHFKAMKPVMQLLADAGQKVITATLNKDPWNVQTYDPYADMIWWTKDDEGTWSYDYTVFDQWVKFMMDLGIKEQINAYSIVPWNNELHYIDEKTRDTITVQADPGTPEFEEMWRPFLKDFSSHLEEKGWLEITNIALDERDPESMDIAFKLIQEVAPGLGVAFADNQRTYQRYPDSYDISVAANHPFDKEDLADRKEHKLITTFYIYCGNEFPNQFTFSDPAESTYLGWYALANGFDGFLRWSYNSWVKDPLRDSRFRTWPAGDTYVVYPGGRSSIRFERTREGIQDYEKARILIGALEEKGDEESANIFWEAIDKLSSSERTEDWNQNLNKAKQLLNDLSKEI